MTAAEYEQQARRAIPGRAADNISYLSFGLVTKVGEVAGRIATAVRRGVVSIDNDEIVVKREIGELLFRDLAHDLGDVLWFVAMLAQRLGYSLEEVMELNLGKLASRQKRGVIIGDGDKR